MSGKKKILFCITKGNFGGAQKYVYDLAISIPKDNFETLVACGTKDGTVLIKKLTEKNIRTIKLESSEREISIKNDLKTIRELIRIIKQEKPNIVHLNSSKIGVIGSLAVLYFKILNIFSFITHVSYLVPRCIFTAHNWAFNEKNRSFPSRAIYFLGHWVTVLLCSKVITVSEKTKRDISFLPFVKDKISVIHNGITPAHFAPKLELATIFGETKGKVILFSISELHPNKGIDIAIRGLSLLPRNILEKILYFVAGSGEQREALLDLARKLEVSQFVRFLGFIEDASKYIKEADIFILPSKNEAFPYVILEAGCAGVPIIATSVGGVPEVIKDMKNGILIHPNNPKEMAEAIMYLLNHTDKQREFGEEIKKTVINFFSLDKMLSETLKIYESI